MVKLDKHSQICVRGKTLCLGFWRHGRLRSIRPKSWYATGDLGRMDNGSLEVLGRLDNMFISGGENIFPEEIERILQKLDGIKSAIVYPINSFEYGQRPVAIIRHARSRIYKAKELRAHLLRHLEKFKVPDRFYEWPSCDNSDGIKVRRNLVINEVRKSGVLIE